MTYLYSVKAGFKANMLSKDGFAGAMPGATEIIIRSEAFPTYDSCYASLTKLLSVLGRVEAEISGRSHVIALKKNPLHDEKSTEDPATWDDNTVVRVYVVDSEILKSQSIMKYEIIGQITTQD
jgi:hypothetical protein